MIFISYLGYPEEVAVVKRLPGHVDIASVIIMPAASSVFGEYWLWLNDSPGED
ncbi:hypothetical protein [Runella slithyformis]|uniref:hypothetical protein n=1 Tax=Runella slithyformis TaxID=106 RepID=UPI00030533A8|nr:hypothetical protein [Runella slithyformis]